MVVQKGTVGVWNGTIIRLFKVEKEVSKGPSFMKPLGAVDAVGSNLMTRIGSLGAGAGAGGGGAAGAGGVGGGRTDGEAGARPGADSGMMRVRDV